MTNQEIRQIALQQSAYDCNCDPEDFISGKNKVTFSQKQEKASSLGRPCAVCRFTGRYGILPLRKLLRIESIRR